MINKGNDWFAINDVCTFYKSLFSNVRPLCYLFLQGLTQKKQSCTVLYTITQYTYAAINMRNKYIGFLFTNNWRCEYISKIENTFPHRGNSSEMDIFIILNKATIGKMENSFLEVNMYAAKTFLNCITLLLNKKLPLIDICRHDTHSEEKQPPVSAVLLNKAIQKGSYTGREKWAVYV